MRLPNFLIPVLFTFLFFDCTTGKKIEKTDHYNYEISFGSTGGFTNINPVYSIKSNGEVIKQDNKNSAQNILKTIEKNKTDSIYWLIKTCDFGNIKIREISNFTDYIKLKSDSISNEVFWYNDSQISPELKNLHRFLLTVIKN